MERQKDEREEESSGGSKEHLESCTVKNIRSVWKRNEKAGTVEKGMKSWKMWLYFDIYLSADFYST